jgi:Molybdopterin-binding domain of aldehyde dehydrogenase
VLNAAAEAAGWTPRIAGSARSQGGVARGRGIGLGTHHVSYGAAVAEIEVDKRTGDIVAARVYAALDAGLIVNPALVENQIVGQVIQATSRMLKEEVTFDHSGNQLGLGELSDPAVRRAPPCHAGCRAAPRRALDRRRRRGHGRDRFGDRQCLLRRDRRALAPISDDARAREGRARQRTDVTRPHR